MGNQESALAANLEAADDDQELFDLSAIEDSREYIEEPTSTFLLSSPAATSEMARGRTRPSRRSKSRSTDLEPAESSGTSPATNIQEPGDIRGLEELRKREPESFGQYDSSEDEEIPSIEQPKAFNPGLRWDLEGKAHDIDPSGSEEPKNPEHNEDGELASSATTPQQNGVTAETEGADEADSDTHSHPESTRVPCPYADLYDCSKTFSHKKSAQRHAKSHQYSFICPVCQKSLARQDSLDRHVALHSDEERYQTREGVHDNARDGETQTNGNIAEDPVMDGAHEAGETANLEETPEISAETIVKRYPCPLAESFSCEKTYETKKGALRHAMTHTTDMSCPLGCIDSKTGRLMLFSTEGARKRHTKNKHDKKEVAAAKAVILERQVGNEEALSVGQEIQPQEAGELDILDHSDGGAAETRSSAENPDEDGPLMYQDGEPTGDEILQLLVREVEHPLSPSEPMEQSARVRGSQELDTVDADHDYFIAEPEDECELQESLSRVEPDGVANSQAKSRKALGKRKRLEPSPSPTAQRSNLSRKKRKGRDTPQTSPSRNLQSSKSTSTKVASSSKAPKGAEVSGSGQRRQSSIANFARPYSEGSQLRHPLFRPESARESRPVPYQVAPPLQPRIIIPLKKRRRDEDSADGQREREDEQKLNKRRKIERVPQSISVKGKERATSDDEASGDECGLATSFARRLSPRLSRQSRSLPSTHMLEDAELDQATEDDDKNDIYALNQDDLENDVPSSKGSRTVMCAVCKKNFKNQDRLDIHLANSKSHQHLLDCEECGEQYFHAGQLVEHRKATGHGQGMIQEAISGRFTETEKATLARWIEGFCSEHDLTRSEFNDVMQASFRFGLEWKYDFMTKKEFNAEFYDVLPHRDVRSMRRYREKAFDSGETSQTWSKEEDRMIVTLLEELGPKWRKIGAKLNRPADMCRQRWKNKLQVKDLEHGQWTRVEEAAFLQAIQNVRRLSLFPSTTFNWGSVSKSMKTRTPQQCANHWRAKYAGTRKGEKWMSLGPGATPMNMPHLAKRSKMEERLTGGPKSSPRKQIISEEYIKESDDDDEGDDENNAPVNDDQENSQAEMSTHFVGTKKTKPWTRAPRRKEDEVGSEAISEEDDDDEPELPRNPLADITPGKTLSTSQVFNQTQANTSAKRFSQIQAAQASQERPSPSIAIEHRREQSPELGTPELEHSQDQAEEEEEERADADADDAETGSETDDDKENIPQIDGQNDIDSISDQDIEMTASAPDSDLVKQSRIEEDAEDTSSASDSDSHSHSTSDSEAESDVDSGASQAHSSSSSTSASSTNSEANSESEAASDQSSSASTSASATPTKPASTPHTLNKKLAEISNSFMDNIYASVSAKKGRTNALRGRKRVREVSSDEEDSD